MARAGCEDQEDGPGVQGFFAGGDESDQVAGVDHARRPRRRAPRARGGDVSADPQRPAGRLPECRSLSAVARPGAVADPDCSLLQRTRVQGETIMKNTGTLKVTLPSDR